MSTTKTILFVDDELPLLQLISELMRNRSEGTWDVLIADSGAKALGILKERAVDLLIVDARMPVMNGLQFIRLVRPHYPHIPAVLLSGFVEQEREDLYLREGVDVILEKPRTPDGYETLYLTLSQVLQQERQQGFRGLIERVEIQDVIQLECLRRKSSVIEVFTPSEAGEIVIRNGIIVHAQVGHLSGEPAFNHLFALKGGEFRIKPYTEPPALTISAKWEVLLMEAARMRDEIAGEAAAVSEAPVDAAARTVFPPVHLDDSEKHLAQPTREFVAVSPDGQALVAHGVGDARVTALAALAATLDGWPSDHPLGRPMLFEATTAQSEVAVQFQREMLLLAVRQRGAHE